MTLFSLPVLADIGFVRTFRPHVVAPTNDAFASTLLLLNSSRQLPKADRAENCNGSMYFGYSYPAPFGRRIRSPWRAAAMVTEVSTGPPLMFNQATSWVDILGKQRCCTRLTEF
jgi:hypothetical protein